MKFIEELKEKNIIEYILYIYQIENIIRQLDFDFEKISNYFIDNNLNESLKNDFENFLKQFIYKMKMEKIEKSGHLSEINEIVVELSYLHNTLLNLSQDNKYKTYFNNSVEHIEEFKQKSNLKNKNHIELMLNALFFNWMLNMQKKELTKETKESMENFRLTLIHLGKSFHKMKKGLLNFYNN